MHILDYVMLVLIIGISLGIGVLFAVKDFRNASRVVYLLGGRNMSLVPVALSTFVTIASSISLLGMPADIYTYGVMACMLYVGYLIAYVCLSVTFVPLLYPLRLTSLYEYLQMRFNSTYVRMFCVVVGLMQTLCIMAINTLAPALALQAGIISNRNQLQPYFVFLTMEEYPGLRGLYLATLFSGSLSTLSSGINSLAAITVEDILKTPLKNVQESKATFITKICSFLYGLLIIGLAYGASLVDGPLMRMALASVGAFGGPIFGILFLGAICPWANSYGAIGGGVISLIVNICMAIGNQFYGKKGGTLPPPTTDMCFFNRSEISVMNHNASVSNYFNKTQSTFLMNETSTMNTTIGQTNPSSSSYFIFDVSHEWISLIGPAICLVLGMVISFFSQRHCKTIYNQNLLFPCVRKKKLLNLEDTTEKHDLQSEHML